MNKDTIVGIDLGTTNSVVSILIDNEPKTIKIDNEKLLPSAVSLSDGVFIVGQTAKNMAIVQPENTCLSIKRQMGKNITIKLGTKNLRPEEISSIILKKIKNFVEQELEMKFEKLRAVITIPAYFTEVQREATKQAAELADIKVERIINEPTAAALSFGLNKIDDAIFAIYDLGGGTFDISIIENNTGIIEVLSSKGNNKLGGDDFDNLLADLIWEKFSKKHKIKEKPTNKEKARLKKIAEETKIKLSSQDSVNIQENFFYKIKEKPIHLEVTISKTEFENLIKPLIEQTISLIQEAFDDADIEIEDIKGILLVGGSSLIPLVSSLIEETFTIAPTLVDLPDEAVSHGATIQGAIINNIDVNTVLVDITPHSLGIKVADDSTSIQTKMMEMLMDGGDPEDIDIDELKAAQKFFTGVIIPKNTPIPVKRTERYSASSPFQEAYDIQIYQGENEDPEDNHFIGKTLFEVEKPVEHGQIDVTFELDINGILKMSAIQVQTGDEVKAIFKSSRGLKKLENKIIEEIATENQANKMLIVRAEKILKKEINDEDKKELENLTEKYKKAIINDDENTNEIETELLDLLFFLEQ